MTYASAASPLSSLQTPTPSAATSRREAWTPAAAALIAFAIALASPAVLGDGDTFWHIAAGEWILSHLAIPRVDAFTFSFSGAPWSAHEWLSEVLFAGAYRLAGWSGVVAMTGAALAATAFVLARRIARDLAGIGLVVLVILGLGLQLGSLLARPHMLALPLLAAWAAGLLAARDAQRAPSFALLPLMALWVNMHGAFMFGLALTAVFAFEAVLEAPSERRLGALRGWGVFSLLALGAALLNPRGLEALLFPFRLMGMKSLAGIAEWRPESFDRVGPLEIELFALIGMALLRPVKLQPVRLALLIGLIHLALHHVRHAMMLGLIGPMILARPIARAVDQPAPAAARLARRDIYACIGLFLVLLGLRLAIPVVRENGRMAPVSALAAVPMELRAKPVLNHYGFGGLLIFSGVRPYIDGRADMFGDAFLDNYDRIVAARGTALDEVLRNQAIEWAIFPPGERIDAALAARPGWKKLYGDEFAVVFARENALAGELRR